GIGGPKWNPPSGLLGVNGGSFRSGSSARKVESLSLFSCVYRKPVKIARLSKGIQNRLALKTFCLIWAVPARSMKEWSRCPSVGTGSPNASSQCVPKMREPERSFVIVVYEYPAVNQRLSVIRVSVIPCPLNRSTSSFCF